MAGTTNWDQNTNKFDKVLTVDNFTAITPSGSIVFSATSNPSITGTIDIENMSISGNLTVAGTATFNKIIAVTSSYSSGSTIFGDALVDTHQFTGSVFITGSSFNWNNSKVITSNITSSMSVASASQALTASFYNGSVTSASYASQAGNSSTIDINVFGSPVDSYLLMSNVVGTTGVAIGGDAELRYNSSTNVLSVPNISATTLTGSLLGTASNAISALTASFYGGSVTSASYAATASKITIVNETSSPSTYYPVFANSVSGPVALGADFLTYTYQPSTNILTVTASTAFTASYVETLNQNVIITGSVAIGTGSVGNGENNLLLGPAPAGGTGEGGQIALLAAGGSYTSSSFLDNWQNQFRVLRGPGATSNAGLMYMDLQSGNTQFVGAVTASAYNGLPNDYLYVTRNTSQTIGSGTWADRDIIFNNSVVSKGISYNTGTGLASLTGGKVYRITARLAWSAAAAYLLEFSCYDSSNTQLGPTVQIVQSTNGSNNISDGTLDFIYAPGSNVDIKIRTTNNTTALTGESIRGDLNTQLIIQQIA